MKKYEDLKELVSDVKTGILDESKIEVIMDNDCSTVSYNVPRDKGDEYDYEDFVVYDGKGYADVEDLWPLIFPKAYVSWC